MYLENTPAIDAMNDKKLELERFDQALNEKKKLFRQLLADIEKLSTEIDQLNNERKTIVTASAEKSLIECRY